MEIRAVAGSAAREDTLNERRGDARLFRIDQLPDASRSIWRDRLGARIGRLVDDLGEWPLGDRFAED
jgi:hypothetical protein